VRIGDDSSVRLSTDTRGATRESTSHTPIVLPPLIPRSCFLAPRMWRGGAGSNTIEVHTDGLNGHTRKHQPWQYPLVSVFLPFVSIHKIVGACVPRSRIQSPEQCACSLARHLHRTSRLESYRDAHHTSRYRNSSTSALLRAFFHIPIIRARTTGAKRRGDECLIRDVSFSSFPPPRL
jgi:hypothetical protein